MDKAYNIFLYMIVFGLALYFLPKLGQLAGLGFSQFNSSALANPLGIFDSSKVLLSFDSGTTFNEGRVLSLDKFYSDKTGRLLTIKDNSLYESFDQGSSWYNLDPINLGKMSILETTRNGKMVLLRWEKH